MSAVEPMMPGIDEVHILWTSEGMSCDGDTVSVTAVGQPAIEDVLMGAIPGLPKVHLHNKVLSPTMGGEEFLGPFHAARRDELDAPFILVVEGSIPNEQINGEGYWTSMGNDQATGEPLTLNWWLDELAHQAWAVVAVGTCAAYGGIHAMSGNPTGCMGLADYLGWDFRSAGGLPIVNIPGCPVQPENFMETLTWVLYQAAGLAPIIPLDEMLRPQWLFGKTVHEGCDRAAYYEQGDFARDYNSPKCLVKVGCWGPVVSCNVPKRGWMNGVGGHDASPSKVKDAGMVLGALGLGLFERVRADSVGKLTRDAFVAEHLEIAAYEMLERVADRAGDTETADVARRNKADEQAMAAKIASLWDLAVDLSLKEEGVVGAPPIPPPKGTAS